MNRTEQLYCEIHNRWESVGGCMRCEKDAKMRRDAVRGADAFQGFCSSFKNRLFIYTTWLSIEKSTDIFIVQSDSSTSPTRGLFQPLPGCLSQVIVRVCCFLAAGCDTHDVQHLSHIHIIQISKTKPRYRTPWRSLHLISTAIY